MNDLKKMILFVFIAGIGYAAIVLLFIFNGTKEKPQTNADSVLILGAQIKGTTKENAYPSVVLKERLDTAVTYLKEYPKSIAIVCGGQGLDEPTCEADVMANYLKNNGISTERIIKETNSKRTKENIVEAKKKRALGKTVIVTSDFHLYRALLLAKRLDIKEVSGLPAVSNVSKSLKIYAREIIALGYGIIFDH